MPVSSRTARQPRPSTSSTGARGTTRRAAQPRDSRRRERERERAEEGIGGGGGQRAVSHVARAQHRPALPRVRVVRGGVLRRRRGLGGEARLARRDEAAVLEPRDRGGGSGIREPIHRRKRLQRRRAAASLLARVRRERVQAEHGRRAVALAPRRDRDEVVGHHPARERGFDRGSVLRGERDPRRRRRHRDQRLVAVRLAARALPTTRLALGEFGLVQHLARITPRPPFEGRRKSIAAAPNLARKLNERGGPSAPTTKV